jgi:anaerobic selenocysteine-containing dehydrogenase
MTRERNNETAKSLKLRNGQVIWVEPPFQKIKAKVNFPEGMGFTKRKFPVTINIKRELG